jgi:hypothetical protein
MSGSVPPDIRNERIKLTATAISNVGVGLFVVGAITPLVQGRISWAGAVYAIIYAGLGWLVHRYARDLLGGLQ